MDLASTWSTYRDFIHLRTEQKALRAGELVRLRASNRQVAAWLRVFGDQRILVMHNLGTEAASDVALDLESGPLCGAPAALYLYAVSTAELDEPDSPLVTPGGGLDGYIPLPNLPGHTTVVIELVDPLTTTEP